MIDGEATPTVGGGLLESPTSAYSEFGDLLKRLRERVGFTQDKAAGEIGVKRPTFTQWESGRHLPAEDKLSALDDLVRADGQLIAAAARARGPQRLRPVVAVDPSSQPSTRPLLQVFADVRTALLGQLVYSGDKKPLGWRRNLVPSETPPTALSTAYGLKTLAILGGLDPRTTALKRRLFDLADRDDSGRIIGWRASTTAAPRIETTAVVYESLQRVGADLDVEDMIRVLRELLDDVAKTRPLVLTTALDAVLRVAPDSALASDLVEALLACRVDFDGILLWPEKLVERRQPLLEPSVAHTARAINVLRYAPGQASWDAVLAAAQWITETNDLNGVSESIARDIDGGHREELTFHSFTSAHVARVLAGRRMPSPQRIGHALEYVWSRYDDQLHLWAWGNGDVPVWMVMDAVSALSDCALALMSAPADDGT